MLQWPDSAPYPVVGLFKAPTDLLPGCGEPRVHPVEVRRSAGNMDTFPPFPSSSGKKTERPLCIFKIFELWIKYRDVGLCNYMCCIFIFMAVAYEILVASGYRSVNLALPVTTSPAETDIDSAIKIADHVVQFLIGLARAAINTKFSVSV